MVIGGSLHHDPCYRGIDGNRALHLAFCLQPLNLLIRDIPQPQPLPRRSDEVFRALGRGCDRARPQKLSRPQRKQKILLGGHQVRAVDREKRIARTNGLPDGIGEDLFDVTGDLAMDMRQPGFVVAHLSNDTDVLRERSHLGRDGAHPYKLLLLRRHEDRVVLRSRPWERSAGSTLGAAPAGACAHCRFVPRLAPDRGEVGKYRDSNYEKTQQRHLSNAIPVH